MATILVQLEALVQLGELEARQLGMVKQDLLDTGILTPGLTGRTGQQNYWIDWNTGSTGVTGRGKLDILNNRPRNNR